MAIMLSLQHWQITDQHPSPRLLQRRDGKQISCAGKSAFQEFKYIHLISMFCASEKFAICNILFECFWRDHAPEPSKRFRPAGIDVAGQ
ncbi:MAG: hypothetical protein WBN88_15580 [Anderseniella sp.]